MAEPSRLTVPLRLALAAVIALSLAGCGAASGSAGATGPKGAAPAARGSGQVTVSGAVELTLTNVQSCRGGEGSFEVLFDGILNGDAYLFEATSDGVAGPGTLPVGKGVALTTELSNQSGATWDGRGEGASGSVALETGLTSGTVDVTLVSVSDPTSKVRVAGSWSCSGA